MAVSTRPSSAHPPFRSPEDLRNNPALSAALASHKPPAPAPPPKRLTKNGFVSSGALAAATRAGTRQNLSRNNGGLAPASPARRQSADTPVGIHGNGSVTSLPASMTGLGYSEQRAHSSSPFRQASPSHIAAVRAAAGSQNPEALGSSRSQIVPRQDPSPERKDERPIPPTNKLVELFEARSKVGAAEVKPVTVTSPSVVLSPRPVRAASMKSITGESERLPSQPTKANQTVPPLDPSTRRLSDAGKRPRLPARQSSFTSLSREQSISRSSSRPTLHERHNSQASLSQMSLHMASTYRPRPRSISLERSMSSARQTPYATPLGSPSMKPSLRPSPPERSLTTQMPVPQGGRREMSRPRSSFNPSKVQPQLNVDALANAIVASSLASSRVPSPHKPTPSDPYKLPPLPPPPRRGGKVANFLVSHHSGPPKLPPRSNSPPKTLLKHTLRSQPTGPEIEKRERPSTHDGRGGKLRKHVGLARSTTVDRVDPADRKLYEGVWAANKGVQVYVNDEHHGRGPSSGGNNSLGDEVHGFLVKDVWKRSGVDDNVLEQIWDLVDGTEGGKRSTPGSLDRVEFVVGTWLVDQALMGRKLPRRLPLSVWESVRVGPALIFRR